MGKHRLLHAEQEVLFSSEWLLMFILLDWGPNDGYDKR